MRLIPEFRELEMGISTSRYLPPMGTAGLARSRVRGKSLLPCPPPRIIEITDSIMRSLYITRQEYKSN